MWTWVLGGAVGLILLAIILHFAFPGREIKIPTIILSTLGGLVVGVLLGLVGAVMYGEKVQKEVYGVQYQGDPMPSGMQPPPVAGGGGGPSEETTKEAAPTVKAGPGGTNLGADYPGITAKEETAKEPAKEPAAAPK